MLSWLPDLGRWAEVVASLLKPGGLVYIAEFHPILRGLGGAEHVELDGSYFYESEPVPWKVDGSYAVPGAEVQAGSHQWNHPLGAIVTALIGAGLTIEYLHEHPDGPERLRPWLERTEGGWASPGAAIPVTFSLRGTAPTVGFAEAKPGGPLGHGEG